MNTYKINTRTVHKLLFKNCVLYYFNFHPPNRGDDSAWKNKSRLKTSITVYSVNGAILHEFTDSEYVSMNSYPFDVLAR